MPQNLRVDEVIAERTVESEVVRNVSIPADRPAAARVVSVNARVEIRSVDLETGFVVINGIIRSTIYYATAEDLSNVVSIRSNFIFTERVAVRGARRGYEADAEAVITDIDFSLINQRSINLEFTLMIDLDISAVDVVPVIPSRRDIDMRRERLRIQRSIRERNFTRNLVETIRLPAAVSSIRRVVDLDNSVQITEIITTYDRVRVRGIVRSNLLFVNERGQLEYADLTYGFNETFVFNGVTPEMNAYVDTNVIREEANLVDSRQLRVRTEVEFRILVVVEELVDVPTDIISPVDGLYPVSRTILVERIVIEERTRISARDTTRIPEGNPDIARVISASGNIRSGSVDVDAERGGVLISGIIDANVIYVAALPQQPVYFAPATIRFSSFLSFPQVRSNMRAFADIDIVSISASQISEREISVRATLDVNILVTERVRVPVITGISDRPVEVPRPTPPTGDGYISYVVRAGDTLFIIAQRYGVSVERLIAINNISNPENIQVGQTLLIPRN